MKRYSVLTYIFGDYEQVHEVKEKDPEAEYILITDNPSLKSDTWNVVTYTANVPLFHKCYHVRFNPFCFVNTDIVVRVDGSIEINRSLRGIVDAVVDGGYDRCLMIHPDRNTVKDEYDTWVKIREYPKEQAARCMNTMMKMGYDPSCVGLFQMGFEVVRKTQDNLLLNTMTYSLLYYLRTDNDIERIDQTVFSMVLNQLFRDKIRILPVSQDIITDGYLMQLYRHNSDIKNTARPTIPPMMFESPCKIWNHR